MTNATTQPVRRGRPRGTPIPYLRAWRRYNFLTQADLAELAHTTSRSIRSIEHGGGANFDQIKRLASAMNITPQWLVRVDPDNADKAES